MTRVVDSTHLPTGDELTRILAALANPHRLRIVATLAGGSVHVSALARAVRLSRPLVHMHLQRLEAAGLVTGRLELSEDGKAMKFFEVTPFAIDLTPGLVVAAARTLDPDTDPPDPKENPATFLAAIGWPTAAIVISIIAFFTIVASISVSQVFATGRRAIGNDGRKEYRRLAEELAAMQRETTAELQKANEALAQLREQTQELEVGLKELDRILKAVE